MTHHEATESYIAEAVGVIGEGGQIPEFVAHSLEAEVRDGLTLVVFRDQSPFSLESDHPSHVWNSTTMMQKWLSIAKADPRAVVTAKRHTPFLPLSCMEFTF